MGIDRLGRDTDTVLLTGRADELGRFGVNAPGGRRLLDAHLGGAERVVLALPRRLGLHLERGGREAQVPTLDSTVQLSALRFEAAAARPRGELDRSLHDGLFRSAFTRDYHAGFVYSHRLAAVDLSSPPRQRPRAAPSSAERTRDSASAGPPAWVPIGLLVVAGTAAVATVGTALALDTRQQFNRTNLQRRAHQLRDDLDTYRTIACASAAVAVGAGASVLVVLSVTPSAQPEAAVSFHGRF